MTLSAPSVTQTVGAASSAANPASITATFASTAAGSLLVAIVAVAGSAQPTITPPAGGWQSGPSVFGAAGALALFYLPNNAGGVTTQAFTLTNAQSAAIVAYEVASGATVLPVDQSAVSSLASAATQQSPALTPTQTVEIVVGGVFALAAAGPTITPAPTPASGLFTAAAAQTSTLGANNVTLRGLIGVTSANPLAQLPNGTLRAAGTLTAATGAALVVSFASAITGPLVLSGEPAAIMASGVGYCGNVGSV